MTRATSLEIYDMAWSPDGESLAVGGTDFVARIINVEDGSVVREISEHQHYVQGIAWDPRNNFIATQSSDRAMHIYKLQRAAHAQPLNVQLESRSSKIEAHGATADEASAKRAPPTNEGGPSDATAPPSDDEVKRAEEHCDGTVQTSGPSAGSPGTQSAPVDGAAQSAPTAPADGLADGRTADAQQTREQTNEGLRRTGADSVQKPSGSTAHPSPVRCGGESATPSSPSIPPRSPRPDVPNTPVLDGTALPSPPPSQRRARSRSSSIASARSSSPVPPLPSIRPPPTRLERAQAGGSTPHASSSSQQRLYGDDRYSGFFRRLSWSPDGGLLATPSGQYLPGASAVNSAANSAPPSGAVYLYARGNVLQSHSPIAVLPGHKSVTLVTKFSPILYRLRPAARDTHSAETPRDAPFASPSMGSRDVPTGIFCLPYRMVYAVATQESVWIYDTQQATPLYCFSNLHYAPFTDLAWSPDGQTLMMSSSDGYCSVAVFDYNELGSPYICSEQPALMRLAKEDMDAAAPTPIAQPPAAADKKPELTSVETQAPPPAEHTPDDTAQPKSNIPPDAAKTSNMDANAPKKKRRVALTHEGPLRPA